MNPRLLFSSRVLYIPLVAGFMVCLLLFILAGEIRVVADEKLYVESARRVAKTGTYSGAWPPGHPWTISLFLRCGDSNLNMMRLFQICCSVVTGWAIIQMSALWFGNRGALLSGIAWACYLPLAFFTHRIWSESMFLALFVPAIYLLSSDLPTAAQKPSVATPAAAGFLFGLSLYFRESPIYLGIPLTALLLIRRFRQPMHAAIFLFCLIVVVLPWTTRNYIRYGRLILMGNTLGINVRQGLNARYRNHDYNYGRGLIRRVHKTSDGRNDWIWRYFISYGPGWKPSDNPNRLDRIGEDLKSAIRYASQHKRAFILTRIKKIADFVTPLSFAVRDLTPREYSGPLAKPSIRRALICVALSSVVLLLAAGWIALIQARGERDFFLLMLLVIGYFLMTSLLVSMSRYRVPIEPFLLVLLGTFRSEPRQQLSRTVTLFWCGLGLSLLNFLWYLNLAEVSEVVERSWR